MLRAVRAQVDAKFLHDGDRLRANCGRIHASAEDFEAVTRVVAQQALGHLAAGGVPGAENQNGLFLHASSLPAGLSRSGASHRKHSVAATPPASCATMNAGASAGRMPAKVSLAARASVTAGLANEVEDVNQYAAVM